LEENLQDFNNLKPFVVYVSGSDTYGSQIVKTGRSDVNILAVVNPMTKQVLLINTPRDYYVENTAGGGARDKLTHCGIYGAECSMQALGDLYGMGIDYYAKINFTGFETLIDAIGGITVYSDVSFSKPNVTVYEGENYFNGSQALAFARERKLLAGGDNARGKNQMKVIKAVLQKMMSGAIITKYAEVLDSLEGMFETSMDRSEINSLVKMQLSDMASWNIQSFAVTGEGDSKTNYSLPGMSVYVMLPDEELVAQASGLINKVVNGEILTEADLTPVK
jgi:LCP family protein required for cell wall assembly